MPRVVYPDLPDRIDRAIGLLGNRVRYVVLRSLRSVGPASRTELAQRTGLSLSLLQTHMRYLENDGIVSVDPPRSEPGHRSRRYVVDADELDALALALTDGLTSQ